MIWVVVTLTFILIWVSVCYLAEKIRQIRDLVAEHVANHEAKENRQAIEPSREERIAFFRGQINACRAVELTIDADRAEVPERMLLAVKRAEAANAKVQLALLGVEP